jgi:hypothetical protein
MKRSTEIVISSAYDLPPYSGSPTTQDPVFTLNEQYSTGQVSPILTEDTSGMVRSDTDEDKGTEPPRLNRKVWTMGSIPTTDKDFLGWCEHLER